MSRQRKVIRKAAADALMNRTGVGRNVFASRSQPLWEDYEVPAICVYCESESIDVAIEAPRSYRRELDLKFEVAVAGADADDQLDELGDRIERLIGRSNRLTYLGEPSVAEIALASERLSYQREGKRIAGFLEMTFKAVYYTSEPDDDDADPVDDLNTVSTEYSLENRQAAADRAADLVTGLRQ